MMNQRRAQPKTRTPLNQAHPLFPYLKFWWTPRFGIINQNWPATAESGTIPTTRGTFNHISTETFDGSTNNHKWNNTPVNSFKATFICIARPTTIDSNERTCLQVSTGGSDSPLFRICQSSVSKWFFQCRDNSGSGAITLTSTTAPVSGRVDVLVGVIVSGAASFWVNGVKENSSASSIGAVTLDKTCIGSLSRTGDSLFWGGDISDCGIFNTNVSDSWAQSLSKNPWQVYAPVWHSSGRKQKTASSSTVKFRKTLSGIGTRTGSRQVDF